MRKIYFKDNFQSSNFIYTKAISIIKDCLKGDIFIIYDYLSELNGTYTGKIIIFQT